MAEQPRHLIDPTANVLSLVAAAIQRQDDLRTSEFKRQDELRAAENRRIDELRKQQSICDKEVQELIDRERMLQFDSLKSLAIAESKRIDAVTLAESRRIDALLAAATTNVSLASEKSSAAAATLASSVASSAEALRAQVAATAQATTTLINQLRDSLEKRLQIVEQNQYQAGGASIQRTEGRQSSQWIIGIIVAVGLVMGQVALRLLGK